MLPLTESQAVLDEVFMEKKNDITFESALMRLEEIVKALESGTAALDASLDMFEEGVALVKLCSSRLDDAEKRISALNKNADGGYDERPFDGN